MQCNYHSTERTYYQDTSLLELEARVVEAAEDDFGRYAVFNKTLFHPQGGGQPDDKGHFVVNGKQFTVTRLTAPRNPNEQPYVIRHYYEGVDGGVVKADDIASQHIDPKARKLYARLHSAGHLLSNVIHELYPEFDGCNGNHFPKTSFVRFQGKGPLPDFAKLKVAVPTKLREYIEADLPVKNAWDADPRTIQFGELPAYPCGGTHVSSTGELGEITIRSVKKEKTKEEGLSAFRIGYDVGDTDASQ